MKLKKGALASASPWLASARAPPYVREQEASGGFTRAVTRRRRGRCVRGGVRRRPGRQCAHNGMRMRPADRAMETRRRRPADGVVFEAVARGDVRGGGSGQATLETRRTREHEELAQQHGGDEGHRGRGRRRGRRQELRRPTTIGEAATGMEASDEDGGGDGDGGRRPRRRTGGILGRRRENFAKCWAHGCVCVCLENACYFYPPLLLSRFVIEPGTKGAFVPGGS